MNALCFSYYKNSFQNVILVNGFEPEKEMDSLWSCMNATINDKVSILSIKFQYDGCIKNIKRLMGMTHFSE